MRFTRQPHPAARPITNRRLAAAERALQRERDKFPLLTDWISEQQPTAEERLDQFQDADLARQQARRDDDAARWRRARTLLRLLPKETQVELLDRWNAHRCPATAEYFADTVFQVAKPLIDAGEIVLPDPNLDPRYRLEQRVEASRQQQFAEFYALQSRNSR